jgi:hypothetical protein
MSRVTKTFDADLELKDAGAVVAGGISYCTVGGVARVLDIGEGLVEGDIIIDVSAAEVDSDDEDYVIFAEVSSVLAFTSDVYALQSISLGSAGTAMGDNLIGDVDMGVGRYRLPFVNEIADGVNKRYLRLGVIVGGTIVTGINFTAYLARR